MVKERVAKKAILRCRALFYDAVVFLVIFSMLHTKNYLFSGQHALRLSYSYLTSSYG